MATKSRKVSAPLTFDLPVSLIGKIERVRRQHRLQTASATVRFALENFDAAAFAPEREAHRQISVRISNAQRTDLKRQAKRTSVSVGEIIRAAIEQVSLKAARRRKS